MGIIEQILQMTKPIEMMAEQYDKNNYTLYFLLGLFLLAIAGLVFGFISLFS